MSTRAQEVGQAAWQATREGFVEVSLCSQPIDADLKHLGEDSGDTGALFPGEVSAPRPLYGTPAPQREMQSERPIHRLAACLCAAGLSFREIAKRLKVSPVSVSNWYRQPWFQSFVVEEVQLTGVEPLKQLLQGAARDSVITLIELRDDKDVPASVRKAAASDLLDRAYGKAPTVVKHESNALDALRSMEAIDREIKEMLDGNEMRAMGGLQ